MLSRPGRTQTPKKSLQRELFLYLHNKVWVATACVAADVSHERAESFTLSSLPAGQLLAGLLPWHMLAKMGLFDLHPAVLFVRQ